MHTLVVGGGFAGLRAALELSRRDVSKVTLVSDSDYFIHHAILPMIALGTDAKDAMFLMSDLLANKPNVKFVKDTLTGIDAEDKIATFKKQRIEYDNLILALGSVQAYLNIPGVKKNSYSINTIKDATRLSSHLSKSLKQGSEKEQNFVVVGGGYSGVELASSLREYINKVNPKAGHQVYIVERSSRLLSFCGDAASEAALGRLESMGVELAFGESVVDCMPDKLLTTARTFDKATTIWTAGVQINPFFKANDQLFRLSSRGKVEVSPYLEATKDIYVIGDNAEVADSGTAKSALHMGQFIAKYLDKKYNKLSLPVYRPGRHMTTISIGDNWSFVQNHGIFTTGTLAQRIRKRYELRSYKTILPEAESIYAWKSANILK